MIESVLIIVVYIARTWLLSTMGIP